MLLCWELYQHNQKLLASTQKGGHCPVPPADHHMPLAQRRASTSSWGCGTGSLEGGSHHPPHWAFWGSSPLHLGDEHPLTGPLVPPTLRQGLGWLKAGPSTPNYPHQARGADTPVFAEPVGFVVAPDLRHKSFKVQPLHEEQLPETETPSSLF